MLQSLDSTHHETELLVSTVLHKLLREHLNYEEPSVIISESHSQSWSYEHQQDSTSTTEGGKVGIYIA